MQVVSVYYLPEVDTSVQCLPVNILHNRLIYSITGQLPMATVVHVAVFFDT